MLDGIDNLIEKFHCLNKSTPIFQTTQEKPGIARKPRLGREQRLGNGPIYYMIIRQKPEQNFVFRTLCAVNANFNLLS